MILEAIDPWRIETNQRTLCVTDRWYTVIIASFNSVRIISQNKKQKSTSENYFIELG